MNLIGHQRQWQLLTHWIQAGSLPHALMFSGPRSVGKTTVAEALTRLFLCSAHQGNDACPSCQLDMRRHPDVLVISRAEGQAGISKQQIKQGLKHLFQSPLIAQGKVLLITESESLSYDGQQTLLKTLEEPVGERLIILITTDADHLLPTIRSRAARLRFSAVSMANIMDGLDRHHMGSEKLRDIIQQARGRPGLVFRSLNQQPKKGNPSESASTLFSLPQSGRYHHIPELVKSLQKMPADQMLDWLTQFASEWQYLDIQALRSNDPSSHPHLLKHAELLEQIPLGLRHHVSTRSVLETLLFQT